MRKDNGKETTGSEEDGQAPPPLKERLRPTPQLRLRCWASLRNNPVPRLAGGLFVVGRHDTVGLKPAQYLSVYPFE
ncbi:hypothetical protein HY442_00145 [Candidatus Parcubacteria bacterium]|nr:hypothetical protein [Candidatus Parcubacteria bacterium]MBI4385644.1 hypothetical protein [Candidatus Parcubacteria bacterium]